MGAALCSNQNKVVQDAAVTQKQKFDRSFKGKKAGADMDVNDQDMMGFAKSNVVREHEKLWQAVELNDCEAAERYLDWNEVFEAGLYDPFGQTMVHKAASQGDAEMLMLLIDKTGAKPDLVNSSLATPLHLACRNGRENVVRFLIGCGVEANQQDEHGQTPLLICCIHGHREILNMMIEASNSGQLQEPLEVDLANHQGLTPLNCVAIKGDFEMVKTLVSRGGANVNQTSPKGCTPLIYAGRGGYTEVVEYLLEHKASPLKQDNAGGTVLHHAIEKAHINVLESMLAMGIDVYSAIEIADNAGRTPIFEAVESLDGNSNESEVIRIIQILCKSKQENGFGANPNVINFNGQTPMFAAARQGSLAAIQALKDAGALADHNNGELVKPEDDIGDYEEAESLQEKYFLEAFKNCMTPLHVSVVLGYEEIALFLVKSCNADVNYQTNHKKYTPLHLCVLANKPEMIMELLAKTKADPMLDDSDGRALLDMVYKYMPSYVETFQLMIETIQDKPTAVIDDDRALTGARTQQEIKDMYTKQMELIREEDGDQLGQTVNLSSLIETNLLDDAANLDSRIEKVYGAKVALCLINSNWQNKEQAMKQIVRQTEKHLTQSEEAEFGDKEFSLVEIAESAIVAVGLTCRDKVIKVLNLALHLFTLVCLSSKIERDPKASQSLHFLLESEKIVHKFLLQSEQSNTRVTNKIHEALLDLSHQPQIGEAMVVQETLEQIRRHNSANQNPKGLMAQLALLYKLVNSFPVRCSDATKSLTKNNVVEAVVPSCSHNKDDIRGAALKILIDVQRQTGAVVQSDFASLPSNVREVVWEKISETQLNLGVEKVGGEAKKVSICNIGMEEQRKEAQPIIASGQLTQQALEKYRALIDEKGSHKDWMQREIALNAMQECFTLSGSNDLLRNDEDFLVKVAILLQTSLDENNIQIFLIAIEVLAAYARKVPTSEAFLDALPGLIQTIALRTTDTNTRVRKRSVELLNQVWDLQLNSKANVSAQQMVANILCEPSLNEKAIVGRIGILIKKALLIDTKEDMSKRSIQVILGRDYEQIAQFACQWCLHKNTKVRQCALKLAVEICRLNCLDPRGHPFKQRISSFILGLRTSIRDPLVKKINEVCSQANPDFQETQYISEAELALAQATKARAASYDVRRVINKAPALQQPTGTLPLIGTTGILPLVANDSHAANRPTIVLPHSEPLTEQQLEQATQLIEMFGKDLITCFYSQTWSSRYAALQKVEEQMHNLDPRRRDAMFGEINRNNLPPEISFKILLKFFEDGLKDPVLKNYITVLDLIQASLPIYFRSLRPEQIRREITPLVVIIISKTSDLKQKIREASINLCLYLTHQAEIGVEPVLKLVLGEMDQAQWEKQADKKDVQNSFGNSNMIVSCLNLLAQFQQQSALITDTKSLYYAPFTLFVNRALKHSNPHVRRSGEALFKTMFALFGEAFAKELKEQKPQLIAKLLTEAKAESADKGVQTADLAQKDTEPDENKYISQQKDLLQLPQIGMLLKGNEDKLQQLRQPNPKKRLIAIVEIKKVIQQKLSQLNATTARDLVEPLSTLMRHLLKDENQEVFLEALNLLKFIVGNLAQHLSNLDLHLMMGQFIALIVGGQSSNMKTRIASDKVVVYFAKHNSIGSLVVAKEVLKNIDRLNTSAFNAKSIAADDKEEDRKQVLIRFYNTLQLLIQQFSIVLCYQPDFYTKCLNLLAETMQKSTDEPALRSSCNQLVVSLHQIDPKLLDQGVQNLDFTKKSHIRKIMIELENSSQKGFVNQNLVGGSGQRVSSPDQSFRDTQQSFTSLQSRTSIMSPNSNGISMNRRLQRDRNSEVRSSRAVAQQTPTQAFSRGSVTNQLPEQSQTGIGWLERKQTDNTINLPSIGLDGSGTTRKRQMGQGYAGGSGKAAGFNRNDFNMTGEVCFNQKKPNDFTSSSGIMSTTKKQKQEDQFPLYVPTQRQPVIKRQDSTEYQPSLLQGHQRDESGLGQMRYKPSIASNQNQTATSFTISENNIRMGSTTASVVHQKPPIPSATLEVKKANDEETAESRRSLYY